VTRFSKSTVILASKRFSCLRCARMQYVTHSARGDGERAAPWLLDNTVPEMPATGTEPSLLLIFQQPRDPGVDPRAAPDYAEPFHSTGASGQAEKKEKMIILDSYSCMDLIMCMLVANYDDYDSQNSEDYPRSMTTPTLCWPCGASQFTCSCFPSTEPGILIPRIRRHTRAYCVWIPNPNSLACMPPGPFGY
jgi:hypothetical protein